MFASHFDSGDANPIWDSGELSHLETTVEVRTQTLIAMFVSAAAKLASFLLLFSCVQVDCFTVAPELLKHHYVSSTKTTTRLAATSKETEKALDEKLLKIAKNLKLDIFDLDEGIFGFDTKDNRCGLEVVKTTMHLDQDGGLGLVLMEVAGNSDGRGLVLVREIVGQNAVQADIQVGDVITCVWTGMGANKVQERTTGLNYDETVCSIGRVKEAALAMNAGAMSLELNRMVERANVRVEVDDGSSDGIKVIDALAGENLRRLLMRKSIPLYDRDTKRYDMPYATGDCAGEGLCGTCLVKVNKGMEHLSEPDDHEKSIVKGRPTNWRAACRTTIGADNKPSTLRILTHPQSRFADELDPGVRPLQ